MNLPSGLVFYLDFQYGSTKNSDVGTSPETFTQGKSLYGGNNTPFSTDASNGEGLYGPGRFGY
jgi:hypothetical protein